MQEDNVNYSINNIQHYATEHGACFSYLPTIMDS